MANPGAGYMTANDVLVNMSYRLVEPIVNTTLVSTPVAAGYGDGGYGDGGYGDGVGTVFFVGSTTAMYAGAMVIVGRGEIDQEIVVILEVGDGFFIAIEADSHSAGEMVYGATFPVAQTMDPFYTQSEMLLYVANAQNDYLVRVPLAYEIVNQAFPPAKRIQPIPSDAIQIERVAVNGYALYEQGQTSLDQLNYTWAQQTQGEPQTWYEDRVGFMNFGVQPVPLNGFTAELLYAQRDTETLLLTDGFLLDDPFTTYVMYGALAAVFSKDGEQRDPERAQYCQGRFDTGTKIGMQFYQNVMAQEVVSG